MTTPKGRLIGYARVSTADQDLATQTRQLAEAGVEEGAIYAEHVTGTRADRPELRNAIKALRSGDTLVVTKLDRLARSLRDLLAIVDELEEKGAHLVVLDQGGLIDTRSSVGRLMIQILGAVAEMERNLISERTREALKGRPRGRRGGRKPVLTPQRRKRAQDLYDAGDLTMREIAAVVGVSQATLYRYLTLDKHRAAATRSGATG